MKRKDGTLRRILSYVAPYRSAFLLVLLFSLLSVAATLYVPILTGNAIDFIIGPNDVNFPRIVPILVQLLVTIGVGALAQYLLGLFTNRLSYGVARDIRLQAMDKIEVVPLKTIDTNSHGDISEPRHHRRQPGLRRPADGLYAALLRHYHHRRHAGLHVQRRRAHRRRGGRGHAAFAAGGQLRRPPHLQHVQTPERHARRIDGAGGGDGRQPEGRQGIRP